MLNVKTLTDTMSRMELPQLQQYATLHKNDPYIVTLALSIANQKKQMKMGQDGQAGMMPQPTVVDQDIFGIPLEPQPRGAVPPQQQMMPEDQGIATLPAQNMQNMAGGGIVAFDEGGDVPGYAEGTLVGQGFRRDQMLPAPTSNRNALIAGTMSNISAQSNQDELKRIEAQIQAMPPSPQRDYLENRKRILLSSPAVPTAPAVPAVPTAPAPAVNLYDPATATRRDMFVDPAAPPVPIGGKRQPPSSASSAAPISAAPVVPTTAGLPALNTKPMTAKEAMAAASEFGDDKEVRKELQSYVDRQKKIGEDAVGSFKEGIAGLPEAYKKYEARLQKEEAEAATDKDKAVGMSIFKAGLAMMSGTSQNAFENIGKGAMVGLEDQQAALKDFKKAQRERDKAFGDIEAARLADQRGDLKTKLELESRAADRTSNAEGKMVEGIAKLFDTNKTNARGIYQTGFEQANQNQRTLTQVNADIQRQGMSDAAAMERTKQQVAGSLAATKMNVDAFKLPNLYKSVEDSVDKMLLADINYKAADEATKATMRDAALKKRLLATPGLAQYAQETPGGGGGAADFVYQNGQLVPRKP
jgi:hypothetical protein